MFDAIQMTDAWDGLASMVTGGGTTLMRQPQTGGITLADLGALIDSVKRYAATEPDDDYFVASPIWLARYEKAVRLSKNRVARYEARMRRNERRRKRLRRKRRAMQRRHYRGGS